VVEPLGPQRVLEVLNLVGAILDYHGISQEQCGHPHEPDADGQMLRRDLNLFITPNWC
jgi:hypothetical protein